MSDWIKIPGTCISANVTTTAPGRWHYILWDDAKDELFAEDTIDLSAVAHVTTLTPEQVAKIAFILESL